MHSALAPAGAAELLDEAEALDRTGASAEAVVRYRAAVDAATAAQDRPVLARALRRLAVLRHHQGDEATARDLCMQSFLVARTADDDLLAAEALNVQAGLEFEAGQIDSARTTYGRALSLGGDAPGLRARIEQNLGILANIQGDLDGAALHYHRALDAYRQTDDRRGSGLALHNLGMLSADRERWEDADHFFGRSREIAQVSGDTRLAALCLLNHSEVHLARRWFDRAMESAQDALVAFDRIGSRLDKADAYRVIGMVYRETGRFPLAEVRLQAARELAASSGSPLSEAEATRELALLALAMSRNQDALTLLTAAHRLFTSLDARLDLVDVARKRDKLEATYFAVVRDWGESIESADSYTFGHCERVAHYALAVARALGLDEAAQTTVRLGAYLHDVGKIKVPHEILNKTGPLTSDEFEIIKQHPAWGVELLDAIEFPWDIKPLIRWHHEKYDGTGYPDRLRGDEIPVAAQILCIVDVYDALTTTRSYRPALTHEVALAKMTESRGWWRPDVFAAFMGAVTAPGLAAA